MANNHLYNRSSIRTKQTNNTTTTTREPKHTVNKEQPFKDKCFLYRFKVDEEGTGGGQPTSDEQTAANEHVREALGTLLHRGSDATLRMILRKP